MQRRSGRMVATLAATAVLSMEGCAIEGLDGQEDTAAQALAVGPCGDEQCGTNSPVINVFPFHDGNLRGVPNNIGLTIDTIGGVAQIVKGFTSYDLHVEGAHITGVRGNAVISGTQLFGATIPVTQGKAHYQIAILTARELAYFRGPAGTVGAYRFEVRADGAVMELCNNRRLLEKQINEQGGIESDFADQELMGMRPWETVVFEGDRVDAAAKTMSRDAAVDDTWFNFGCAGHTLAKLLLTHNTYHSQALGIPRPWEQRQATLKLLAADYCGGGVPFTVAGQRLVWRGDVMTFNSPPAELEARWNEKGALCLNVPRLDHPTSALGSSTFPNVKAAILATCRPPGSPPPPPPCKNLDPYADDGGYRVSGNP